MMINYSKIDISEVENAILLDESVLECAVDLRSGSGRNASQTLALIVYVVANKSIAYDHLRRHLKAGGNSQSLPLVFVPVSAIPLTGDGRIDYITLRRLYVIDSQSLSKWEREINEFQNVRQAAVVRDNKRFEKKIYHIDDLLDRKVDRKARSRAGGSHCAIYASRQKKTFSMSREAISAGKALRIDNNAGFANTLTQALLQTADRYGDSKGIWHIQDDRLATHQTYQELIDSAKSILRGLQEMELKPADPVILQIRNFQTYFPAFWACVLGGFIPLTVAPAWSYHQKNNLNSKLFEIWKLLNHPLIIAGSDVFGPIQDFKKTYSISCIPIVSVDSLKANAPANGIFETKPDDVLFYQLTSGSTGVPKCIPQTHRNVISHIHASMQNNLYTCEDVTLNWLPMDHVVPILTFHIKDVYLGCSQVEVPTQLVLNRPTLWFDLIQRYNVTHSWSPNFGFKLVSKALATQKEHHYDLSTIRYFMNAGEQVTLPVVSEFLELTSNFGLRPHAMQPAFGMAEICTCITYNNRFSIPESCHFIKKQSLDEQLQFCDVESAETISFIDLGRPVAGVEIRIVDDNNRVLSEDVIGRLQIRGNVVTPGYVKNDPANAEAFVDNRWFNSGDLGYIHQGRLVLTGREKEMIIVNGTNFYCYEIEDIVNEIDRIETTYVGACEIHDHHTGSEGLALFFSPKKWDNDITQLVKEIHNRILLSAGIRPSYVIPVHRKNFPKTTSGKIQRNLLMTRFLAGDFNSIVKQLDILQTNENTIPPWFYEQYWMPGQIMHRRTANSFKSVLIISEKGGIGKKLVDKIDRRIIQKIILIETGDDFKKVSSSHFITSLDDASHRIQLIHHLHREQVRISDVLYLLPFEKKISYVETGNGPERFVKDQAHMLETLLCCIRFLGHYRREMANIRIKFTLVINGAVCTGDDENVLAFEKASMTGFLKSIDLEVPWLTCRYVDFSANVLEPSPDDLISELLDASKNSEIAYRKGTRLVPALVPKQLMERSKTGPLPSQYNGFYIITGALGGIGQILTQYLLEHGQAKLLLIGTTDLADHSSDSQCTDERRKRRINALDRIHRYKNRFIYAAIDVCDYNALKDKIDYCEKKWGMPLSGVIHLAGCYKEASVLKTTMSDILSICMSKMMGALNLHRILAEKKEGVFINFSSVNGFFGGVGVAAYSAANSFLPAFTSYQNRHPTIKAYCLSWSAWDDVGMSRDNPMKDFLQNKGFMLISRQRGLNSFLLSLAKEYQNVIIGLDGDHPEIQRYIRKDCRNSEQLTIYYTGNGNPKNDDTSSMTDPDTHCIKDRYNKTIPTDWIQIPKMPLDEKGNIDRRKLSHAQHLPTEKPKVRRPNELELSILNVWKEVLEIQDITIDQTFIELGGASIEALKIISRFSDVLDIELSLNDFFSHPTISKLASFIQHNSSCITLKTQPAEWDFSYYLNNKSNRSKNEFPLSFSQEALWQIEKNTDSWSNNMPMVLHIAGKLNLLSFQHAIQTIIDRHPSLRTTFHEKNNRPYQVILPHIEIHVELENYLNLTDSQINQLIKDEQRNRFDLSNGPLMRVRLLQIKPDNYLFLWMFHHLVFDGASYDIVFKELSILYNNAVLGTAIPLDTARARFVDFIQWEREYVQSGMINHQLDYWNKNLQGYTLHPIEADYKNISGDDESGRHYSFALDRNTFRKIKRICSDYQVSLFTVLLSIFDMMIHCLTEKEEIIVGTIVSTRKFREVENVTGFFINALALRSFLTGNPEFVDILKHNRRIVLNAFMNSDVPFGDLIQAIGKKNEHGDNPFFQAILVLQNFSVDNLTIEGLNIRKYCNGYDIARGDLILEFSESGNALHGVFFYKDTVFKPSTIKSFANWFKFICMNAIETPHTRLNTISREVQTEMKGSESFQSAPPDGIN